MDKTDRYGFYLCWRYYCYIWRIAYTSPIDKGYLPCPSIQCFFKEKYGRERKTAQIRVNIVLKRITEDFAILADEKDINLILNSGKEIVFETGLYLFEHIISNLLDNAIRYTSKGGNVKIKIQEQEKEVIVSISDTGLGISKADLPYIFDRFYRTDKSRPRKTGGVGLELVIIKEFVGLLNGHIKVKVQ